MGYVLKHVKLAKNYFIFNFKIRTEYKFQSITSFISHIVLVGVWILFWDLIFTQIEGIGKWNFPMLLLMIGFIKISDSLTQIFFYVVFFHRDIIKGEIDKYLVRPINPLYGMVMNNVSLDAISSLLFGIGMVVYVLITSFSPSILAVVLALICCIVASLIWMIINSILSTLSFWFGMTTSVGGIFRSFQIGKTFPLDILKSFMRSFYTFIFPGIFFGTYPVLMAVEWGYLKTFKVLLLVILIGIFWGFVLWVTWRKGVRQYESFGG